MTSKERVRAAINHQPVDEVPLGFYAVDYDTVQAVLGRRTYVRNKVESQIAIWEGRRDELVESFKKDAVDFYRKIDCADLIIYKEAALVPPKGYEPDPPERIADDMWRDRHGNVYKVSEIANEIVKVESGEQEEPTYTAEDFERPVQERPPDPSVFEAMDYLIEQLGHERYIAAPAGGMTVMPLLGGMAEGLMMYVTHPEVVEAAIRRNVQRGNIRDEYYIRPGHDGAFLEEDFGGTMGPLISPSMFEQMCAPGLKRRVQHVKQLVPEVIFHSCGDNRPLMSYIVDAGADCYQSMQTNAGMEVGALTAKWGDKMAFWGGVAVENLIGGTPEDVRNDVRTAIQRGAPGSGFILGPSHSIAKGTKYDNFMAMLDEYDKWKSKF